MPRETESRKDLLRIKHIRDAAREALVFSSKKTKDEFLTDRQLALALVKEIEIIGEAASKVSTKFQKLHPDVPWKVLIETRNRLIHGYFDLDLDIIWETVRTDLPKLLELLKTVLP